MKRSSRRCMPATLSESLHHQLNAYALAASAAGVGVGVLALVQPSEAKIVYTATHHVIEQNSRYNLDLNHDGKTDFLIRQFGGCSTVTCAAELYIDGLNYGKGNLVEGVHQPSNVAYALKAGAQISAKRPFQGALMYYRLWDRGTRGTCKGQWVNVTNRYLGLQFMVKGKIHFGWARLSVTCPSKSKALGVLTGYAYETIPNKAIIAGQTKGPADIDKSGEQLNPATLTMPTPEPATLGSLAMGARGLEIWRRKETQEVIRH
jgi:hypothetical protein